MKKLIIGLLIVLVAIGIGYLVHQDSGYVLISYGSWSIETSFWIAIIGILFAYLLLYFIFRVFYHIANLGFHFERWGKHRSRRKTQKQTLQGVCQLAEGKWAQAEKTLVSAAKHHEVPVTNYLAAARAAQLQGAYDRRDQHIRSAAKATPDAKLAVLLRHAMLQIDAKQWQQATSTLTKINNFAPNQPRAMQLLQRVYCGQKDWDALSQLLPRLRKNKLYSDDKIAEIEKQVYCGLLTNAFEQHSIEKLKAHWESFPKNWRRDFDLIACYTDYLIRLNHGEEAATLIEKSLKHEWSSTLAGLYGQAETSRTAEQIKQAEKWLRDHSADSELLRSLGLLCLREKLWGKAQEYLEKSLLHASDPHTHMALARVHEALGDTKKALHHYRFSHSID